MRTNTVYKFLLSEIFILKMCGEICIIFTKVQMWLTINIDKTFRDMLVQIPMWTDVTAPGWY